MWAIDADARVTVFSFDIEHEEYEHTEMSVAEALDFATDEGCPDVVEAEPIVHARWFEKRWITECDWCVINHRALVCTACSVEIADGEKTPYCPYCGAKMDGGENAGN